MLSLEFERVNSVIYTVSARNENKTNITRQ